MKKRFVISLILTLVLALSFGFSACGETLETTDPPHEHSWATDWLKDESYHWHAPLCDDTAEIKDRTEHSFVDGKCSVCGFHIHSWSTEWSTDFSYHWYEPLCGDTTELKDKNLHSYNKVNDIQSRICSECGYKCLNDVGEKYYTVVEPIYEVAEIILYDLANSGEIVLNEWRNPRITEVMYLNGSFEIAVQEDVYIIENGEKSEFLQREKDYELENFSELDSEVYLTFREFLRIEHESQHLSNYEEVLLPYAQKSAEMILAQYEIYKNSPDKNIEEIFRGKQLNLSADSFLSETYEKIVDNLNSVLEVMGYTLITNQVLNIGFGGSGIYVKRWILIDVSVGTMHYSFYLSFNENGEFSENYLNHFKGTLLPGYEWSEPDMYNPLNEEYAELFERVKIEEIDLSNIQGRYGYDGVGCAFYCAYAQVSHLYFNNTRKA